MTAEEFNHIIVPMRDDLKRQARNMTGDDSRAEDLVQEVLLKMWSMRSQLDMYDNKKALAVTILKNKAKDAWKHDRFESGGGSETAERVSEDHTAENTDEISLIRTIVEHLPPLQRKLFKMKEIEGYDSAEIMQITGCSADSLRQNLSRARRKILADFAKLTRMRIKKEV